jgi:hypothetical protein
MVRFGLWGVGLSSLLWAYAKMPFSDPWMAPGLFAAFCHWRWRSNVPSRAMGLAHAVWCGFWLGVALLSAQAGASALVPMLPRLLRLGGASRFADEFVPRGRRVLPAGADSGARQLRQVR